MESTVHPAVFGIVVALGLVVAFVGLWFIVTTLLASVSGWTDLADTFPAGPRPRGEIMRRLVMKVGTVGEKGATSLIAAANGLYLEAHPLFRFRRPSVLVPWDRIRFVQSHRVLWQRSVTLDLGGATTIRVRDKVVPVLRANGVNIPENSA
jgi:hypothetical protein